MSELKPCPFCGGEAKLHEYFEPPDWHECSVGCPACGVTMVVGFYDKDATIEAWNTRWERTTRIVQGSEGTPFGENIVIPLVCEVCGHGISVKDSYCRTCGARIKEDTNA